jgi:hypothetical protein
MDLIMRVVQATQTQLGDLPIGDITFNLKSRDDIPQLLRGLQYLYINAPLRQRVFDLLEKNIQPDSDHNNGRPGMNLWSILVMGVLRLDLNWDYDRLHEQVNQHKTIRQMLGHADFFDTHEYQLQTLKDNVRLLTPALLDELNQVIVEGGHALVKKKKPPCCVLVATPLSLRPMCIIRPTLIYCSMPCEKSSA